MSRKKTKITSEPSSEMDKKEFSLVQLLPNMMTIAAMCAGLSAIRFGIQNEYVLAVQLILAAAVLDGLDGRVARALGSESKMGAELDSLADFLNFGVAPPLVIYYWALLDAQRWAFLSLENMRSMAWISVLIYAVCCIVRLARFNVDTKTPRYNPNKAYFTGVPSPAGALLLLLPMYVSFAFSDAPLLPDIAICAYMIVIGLLLISPIKTWSFKTTRIRGDKIMLFLVAFAFIGATLLTYAWVSLLVLCAAYVFMVIWGLIDPVNEDGTPIRNEEE